MESTGKSVVEIKEFYSKDGAFNEPVLICDSCTKVVLKTDLHRLGMCPECGNTRFRNVRTLNDENLLRVNKWVEEGKVDPDWLKLFEEDKGE